MLCYSFLSYDNLLNMKNQSWDIVLSKNSSSSFKFDNLSNSVDLLILFFKRDFTTTYKQTILGPLWYIIQPALSTILYIFVFHKIAGITTSNIPVVPFYLSGTILWGFIADTVPRISNSLRDNQYLFSKVYFPRIILPLSIVLNGLMKIFIQLLFFIPIYFYFWINGEITLSLFVVYSPLLLLWSTAFSLGLGLTFAAITSKYRDLIFSIGFIMQFLLYVSPILYPLSAVSPRLHDYFSINPLTSLFETMRVLIFSEGSVDLIKLSISLSITTLILAAGLTMFDKTQKNFIDTV